MLYALAIVLLYPIHCQIHGSYSYLAGSIPLHQTQVQNRQLDLYYHLEEPQPIYVIKGKGEQKSQRVLCSVLLLFVTVSHNISYLLCRLGLQYQLRFTAKFVHPVGIERKQIIFIVVNQALITNNGLEVIHVLLCKLCR